MAAYSANFSHEQFHMRLSFPTPTTSSGSRPNPSRETEFSGANGSREIFISPVQPTTSRVGNLTRLIHTLLHVMTIHTVHTVAFQIGFSLSKAASLPMDKMTTNVVLYISKVARNTRRVGGRGVCVCVCTQSPSSNIMYDQASLLVGVPRLLGAVVIEMQRIDGTKRCYQMVRVYLHVRM